MVAKTKTRVVPLPKLVGRVSDRELVRIVRDVSEGGDLNIPFSRHAFEKEVRSEFAGVVCERYLPLKEKDQTFAGNSCVRTNLFNMSWTSVPN